LVKWHPKKHSNDCLKNRYTRLSSQAFLSALLNFTAYYLMNRATFDGRGLSLLILSEAVKRKVPQAGVTNLETGG
jgi:hypothetical protein